MDKLLSTIKKSRVNLQELKGDKRWIRQSDEVEKRRINAQEQLERNNELKKKCMDEKLKVTRADLAFQKIELFYDKNDNKDEDATYDRTKDIPVQDVVNRLRKLRKPATLFGETHQDRLDQLNRQVRTAVLPGRGGLRRRGEPEHLRGRNHGEVGAANRAETTCSSRSTSPRAVSTPTHAQSRRSTSSTTTRTCPKTRSTTGTRPTTPRIFHWISLNLKDLEKQILASREELIKAGKAFEAKKNEAMLVQTKKDIKPLLKLLKSQKLHEDVLEKLHRIVDCCEKGEFREAHDAYMLLAIGNAPWPMGVTMVGIHERAGRSKIFTSEVAHILNDETTRKYIQMIKRLISLAQTREGKEPSKIVEMSTVHM